MGSARKNNSVETIMTINNKADDLSDWSIVWSTSNIPGMDRATGAGSTRLRTGRRRLRIAGLTLGFMLTMHCHVTATALTSGYFVLMLLLIPAVWLLGNPMRHFEVYLGQWSLSGPGRAFRIIPMFDGIGMAICAHTLMRAIVSATMGAMTLLYVKYSATDGKLPYTLCRTTDLKTYEPELRIIKNLMLSEGVFLETINWDDYGQVNNNQTVGLKSNKGYDTPLQEDKRTKYLCKETFPDNFPPIFRTPPYNFFYVELLQYRPNGPLTFNVPLIIAIVLVWGSIWLILVGEKLSHNRIIWNNMFPWFSIIPWLWAALVLFAGFYNIFNKKKIFRNVLHIGGDKEVFSAVADAFILSMYIHASGLGTEIIHGKGLNFYAAGHIDPHLHGENAWHSASVLILTVLTSGGTAACAFTDYMQMKGVSRAHDSTLWVLPMFSKCASLSNYSHITSLVLFAGLTVSYVTVAFICVKTALHIIFEYMVKLVFVEQIIVGGVVMTCFLSSLLFTTSVGLPLLEAVDTMLTGVALPFVCALEAFGLVYVYRSHDFVSDMNIATEDNACSVRIGIQWQILPFLCLVILLINSVSMGIYSEIPSAYMWAATISLAFIVLALPLRACYNTFVFLRPPRRANQ